jgi:dTDP-4-dehydrorhamnose reductase
MPFRDGLRIAVTGTQGQVAQALRERGAGYGAEVVTLGRPDLDLMDPATVAPVLRAARPDIVVNAAAYTAVDRAESEPEVAEAVNGRGAGAVAAAAVALGVPIVHLSTDYVFAGDLDRPYREDDPTSPTGAYGRSKLAGEAAVAATAKNHVILRTAWVYSPFGANFVKTMLRLAGTREVVTVVADQHGSPTSALDIADGIVAVCRNLAERPNDARLRGVFHMAGTGYTTWAGFACAVFEAAAAHGGPSARVDPIPTSAYPTAAKRPANSRLDCGKLRALHGIALPNWRTSTTACVARLLDHNKSDCNP